MQSINQKKQCEVAAEFPVLTELFQQLNDADVEYCVLRNYDNLPYNLKGSDLDILVDKSCCSRFHAILEEISREHGGRCIGKLDHPPSKICLCGTDDKWWGAEVDIFSGNLKYRQYDFFNGDFILKRSKLQDGVRVANEGDAAIIALFKECLNNLKCREDYIRSSKEIYRQNQEIYLAEFQKMFSSEIADLWNEFLLDRRSQTIGDISRKTRKSLRRKALREKGWKSFLIDGIRQLSKYKRVLKPPGFCVAVLGTDGSGKSTVIEGVQGVLKKALHNSVYYGHLRPGLLPSLARLFGKPVKEGPTTEPHAGKPSGFFGSLIRLSYYTMDYVLGYWIKLFPALVKRPCLYIFDRYFYDYYIDPRRSLISLPRWIVRIFGLFIPRPDIILCVGAEPEIIHARKPELPLEECKRQIEALRQFCNKDKRAVWIDTGCSIEKSVDEALEAITSHMAARYE